MKTLVTFLGCSLLFLAAVSIVSGLMLGRVSGSPELVSAIIAAASGALSFGAAVLAVAARLWSERQGARPPDTD